MADSQVVKKDERVSPYTLYGSDNPGAAITSVLLNGENYNEWSSEMLNALQAKRKLGFITGTLTKPDAGSVDLENWLTVNSMIVGWIRTSIESKVRSTVTYITDAHQLWEDLKQRFSVGNTVRVHQLKAKLASCRQEGQSVLDYFGKLSALWEELQVYQPVHVCSCGAATAMAKERDQERIHQFVMGLDDSRFGSMCTNIIGLDPLPSLGEIYNKIIREEQRLAATRVRDQQQEAVGFVARQNTSTTSNDASSKPENTILRSRMLCSHCGRTGHEKRDCWQLVGYPEWYTERNAGRGQSSGSRGRGGRGSGGRGRGQVSNAHATSSNTSSFAEFTPDQLRALSQILQTKANAASTPAPASDKLSGKKHFGEVILDTGASHHMTGDQSLLTEDEIISPCSVAFADGNRTLAVRMGSLRLSEKLVLHQVLYVPDLKCTLISVAKLLKQTNCLALFTDSICVIQDRFSRILIGAGKERDGVYYLTEVVSAKSHRASLSSDQVLWHRRLGHPSFTVLSDLFFISSKSAGSSHCDTCFRAKQTREIFYDSMNKTTDCFSLIHVDVWGPYRIPSSCGAVYFLTIVDDFSRAVWTFLLLEKSEVQTTLKTFIQYADKQFNKPVRMVRSDNGTEFMVLSSYFKDNGIVHQTSCVGTPQQNGRVERKHRHILNVARSLMFQASLPIKFWGEAVLTAAHVINRTPTAIHHGRSPYEVLHGVKPDYNTLRVFGSACYTHRMARDKDKFGQRSRLCVFVGYQFGKKGWKVYDIDRDEFIISRDVIFREDIFPYAEPKMTPSLRPNPVPTDDDWVLVPSDDRGSSSVISPVTPPEATVSPIVPATESTESAQVTPSETVQSNDTSEPPTTTIPPSVPVQSKQPPATTTLPAEQVAPEPLGRGLREKTKTVALQDYHLYKVNVVPDGNTHFTPLPTTTSSDGSGTSLYPLSDYITDDQFSPGHRAFLVSITSETEPKNFKEAMQLKVWRDSVGKEIVALEDNHTWDITDLPPGKEAIGCLWVFKIKFNADGTIERHKSRLVVNGKSQVEGEDYKETFAPVVKMTTVRSLLRLVAANQWEVYQMDVSNAFLHGDLDEEVYMKLPPGFRHTHPNKVCKLRKSLYGLKQAPRCWFKKLSDALLKFSFVQSREDHSLFSLSRKGIELRVLVYVDDLVICGNDAHMLRHFKEYLCRCFAVKDLGKLKYFLGIEISRGPEGIFISQRKYSLDIVTDTGNLGSKPALTPLEQNHKLAESKGPLLADPKKYRRLMGRLIYLLNTRPDLCYSIHILS